MANLPILDGAGNSKYIKSSGAGSDGDPYIPQHLETNSAAILTSLQTLDDAISGSEMQVDVVTSALPTGAATSAKQDEQATLTGAVNETAPAGDTADSGLNGRLQRIAQRLTSLIALIPTALTGSGNFKVAVEEALPAGANAIGKLSANSGVDIGDVDVTSISAGENHIGQIGTDDTVIDVTCSLDTSAYTSGDVLFDTQSVSSVGRVNAGVVVLQSIFVLDEDDQGAAIDIYFLDANNSLGTENGAPNISDANARSILGYVSISSADYKDLGGCKMLTKTGIGLVMKLGAGVTTLYIAGVTGGTPTHTASGLRLKLGFLRA